MKRSIILLLLVLLILLGFSFFFWLYEVRYFIGRATVIQSSFSLENSYLFVSPLRAKANKEEKIRTTVFILNNQGLGVPAKKVYLYDHPDLNIETIQGLTDGFGKAVFDVSSSKAGEYYIEVYAEGRRLNQKAHLSFY